MFALNKYFMTPLVCIFLLAIFYLPLSAAGTTVETTSADQESLAITIYNSNIGLVKDTRNLNFPSGMFELKFADVAAKIDVGSVHLKSLTAPDELFILEQNYEFDLVSQAKLLEKYLGHEIQFETEDGERVKGVLLSHGFYEYDPYSYSQKSSGGWVVDMGGDLYLGQPGTPILPELPEGLIIRPTLLWLLGNDGPAEHKVEMSYLTEGTTWEANYVAIIAADDEKLDLSGWVSLTNQSGATYPNATLKLVAGDIHRVPRETRFATAGLGGTDMATNGAKYGGFEEEGFFEYHLYTLSRPTTLKDKQTKQISLFTAEGIPALKVFMFDPGNYQRSGDTIESKCLVKLRFKNSESHGLGIPLPKGIVRAYKADASGMLQFVGEDRIKHTPKDEELDVLMGEAFDVVCVRKVMDRRAVGDNVWEYDVEVEVRNHKTENIEVVVVDHAGGDWAVMRGNYDYEQVDASTLHFVIPVSADGKSVLNYTIRRKG